MVAIKIIFIVNGGNNECTKIPKKAKWFNKATWGQGPKGVKNGPKGPTRTKEGPTRLHKVLGQLLTVLCYLIDALWSLVNNFCTLVSRCAPFFKPCGPFSQKYSNTFNTIVGGSRCLVHPCGGSTRASGPLVIFDQKGPQGLVKA